MFKKKSSYNSYNYLLLSVLAGVLQDKKKIFYKKWAHIKEKKLWKTRSVLKNNETL